MTESPIGTNFVVAFNPSVVNAIQDRTLVRVFKDALFPRLLYRGDAAPELWPVNLGTNQTFTRTGLIAPTSRPLAAGQDPTPQSYQVEQWEVTAQQWGSSIDTHMPTSYASLASLYLRNMHQLGLHAGMSINRACRDKLFNAYLGGNTAVSTTTGASTSLPVVSLNGFTRRLLNGRPAQISASNPLLITIVTGGGSLQRYAVAFTPTFAGDETRGGVLTLDAAHTGVTARDLVLASNRSVPVNAGGSIGIDPIDASDVFTMAHIREAVSQLRTNNVPTHEDGTYHCHLGPVSESQIFGDQEFQRLNQSLPDYLHYREFALAMVLGVTFYRNTEAPTAATVNTDPVNGDMFAAELLNGAVTPNAIHRPIFTGAGHLEEKYLDESKYISEAGVTGKIGEFAVMNNGVEVMAERIRLILRSPLDRLQQVTSSTWSFSGAFAVPTDETTLSSPASFKRAVVVQHGA